MAKLIQWGTRMEFGIQEFMTMLLSSGAILLKIGLVIAVAALLVFYIKHRKK